MRAQRILPFIILGRLRQGAPGSVKLAPLAIVWLSLPGLPHVVSLPPCSNNLAAEEANVLLDLPF